MRIAGRSSEICQRSASANDASANAPVVAISPSAVPNIQTFMAASAE
jgi:hypothetical protein